MADINMTHSGVGSKLPASARSGYKRLKKEIDFADVLAAKGAALAAADVIQVFDTPAGVRVVDAQIHVVEAGNSTTLTLDLGTDIDPDQWIDGLNGKTVGMGTPLGVAEYLASADTIDVTLATLTGILTTGKIVVVAIVADLTN